MDKKKKYHLYCVEWHDAHSNGGWHTEDEIKKFINQEKCICQEVGWILYETKYEIVMACRRLKWVEDGDAQWGMLQKIPKSWIRKKKIVDKNSEFVTQ